MATASFATTGATFTLVSSTAVGALYRDLTRPLALPRTLEVQYSIGQPGQKGNDRATVKLSNSTLDELEAVRTATVTLGLSAPRNTLWALTDSSAAIGQLGEVLATAQVKDRIAQGAAI